MKDTTNINLVIDIGNTSIKVGLFDKNILVEKKILESIDHLLSVISGHRGPVILSNVGDQSLTDKVLIEYPDTVVLSLDIELPITLNYNTPDTFGLDRVAACCGAITINDAPCLVVDIGTCMTLDIINSNNQFLGGNISPGPVLRFRAMNNFTASLPLEDLNEESALIGKSTSEALQSGVKFGIIHEIQGLYQELKIQDDKFQLVLTGGYSTFFDSKLKESIFVEPNLVLIGLNTILNCNVKK